MTESYISNPAGGGQDARSGFQYLNICSPHIHKAERRKFLMKVISQAVKIIDAKKTLSTNYEYELLIDEIEDKFITMSYVHFDLAFRKMIAGRYGQYYERFKVAEIVEGLTAYQKEVDEARAKLHKQNQTDSDKPINQVGVEDVQKRVWEAYRAESEKKDTSSFNRKGLKSIVIKDGETESPYLYTPNEYSILKGAEIQKGEPLTSEEAQSILKQTINQ